MQGWLRDDSVNVLKWPSQSPDLNPIKHLWRDLKTAVHQQSPSNPTELERICREACQKIPKSRFAKLATSCPRRLQAVIASKGDSTKNWVKGLNTYINVIFQFFLFNTFAKISKILFLLSHYGVWSVELWGNKMNLNYFSITKCEKSEGAWILSECTALPIYHNVLQF